MAFKPKLWMLGDAEIKIIVDGALYLLENTGVFVENQEAIQLLQEAGMEIKDGRVLITEYLVDEALESAPSLIELYDRSGKLVMQVGRDNVHFISGSAAIYFRDSQGNIRKPDYRDYIKLVKVTDALPNITAQSTAMIPANVPAEVADRYRLYLSLLHSPKPVVTGTFIRSSFNIMKEMLVAVRGSEEELRRKPLAIFDACPSPPLQWSNLTCQALIDSAKLGIPAELIAMPLTGTAAPTTLHGAIIQHTAESLSGVVIHQLASPGAPIIYGGSPAGSDMRYLTACLGAIETFMIDSAYAQVGKYLDLPTHAYMGVSDAKDLDGQMGAESGIGAVLAALSGVNIVAMAGMLGSENCQSLEKLVFDNEICGMALRCKRGVCQRSWSETGRVIQDCIESGSFLEHPTTARLFREEHFIPKPFIDRTGVADWLSGDRKNLESKLKDEVERILRTHTPDPLDPDTEKELRNIWVRQWENVR